MEETGEGAWIEIKTGLNQAIDALDGSLKSTSARFKQAQSPEEVLTLMNLVCRKRKSPEHYLLGAYIWRRDRDSNPGWSLNHAGFQDRCIQPLCHPSEDAKLYR